MICKYVYEDRRSHDAETADTRSGTCSCVERCCEACQRRCETRTRTSEVTEGAAELTASTAYRTRLKRRKSSICGDRTLFYADKVPSLTGIVKILYCASASIVQQSASHSFTQLRTVRTAERANRVTLTTHLFVLRNVFRRVSTLIIRWCRVRLSGGPPLTTLLSQFQVSKTAAKHSRTQFFPAPSNLKTLSYTASVLF